MALVKTKKIKGVGLSYWKITDCNIKTGEVSITPFYDKEAGEDRNNIGEGIVNLKIDFPVDVVNPLSYAYVKIKESKMETIIVTEAVKEVLDKENNVLVDAVEAVTEEVESNWFADAVDDL